MVIHYFSAGLSIPEKNSHYSNNNISPIPQYLKNLPALILWIHIVLMVPHMTVHSKTKTTMNSTIQYSCLIIQKDLQALLGSKCSTDDKKYESLKILFPRNMSGLRDI